MVFRSDLSGIPQRLLNSGLGGPLSSGGLCASSLPPPPENPMSADRIRWEHIQRVFTQCNRNVSETARRLKMHRRTLQRILNKHAPKE